MSIDTTADTAPRRRGGLKDYLAIARLDHSTKHIFVVPGIAFAYMLRGVHTPHLTLSIILGFVAAIAIASANYVINEYLDRDFDRHHPTKSSRAAVQTELSGRIVLIERMLFVAVGLGAAWVAAPTMFWIALIFASQGVFYNVPPLRTKDKAYLDVISEWINNPLRLAIGWAMVDPGSLPPSSVLFSYWFGGAFLMAAKRLSEYRQIVASHGMELLTRYRASFLGYSELSLNLSCFVYAMLANFFLAVFLIKYRIEYFRSAVHDRLCRTEVHPAQMSPAPFDWDAISLVAFDVDGTLYRQRPLRIAMAREMAVNAARSFSLATFRILGVYRRLREEVGDERIEDFDAALIDRTARATGATPDRVRALVADWMETRPLRHLARCRYPGLDWLFAGLRAHGKTIAILSDYPAVAKVAALGLEADLILSAGEIGVLKPDSRGLLTLIERAGTTPAHTVLIGDRIDRDGIAAREAGAHCLIRTSKPEAGWHCFTRFDGPDFAAVLA